jgi:hypothetical protein
VAGQETPSPDYEPTDARCGNERSEIKWSFGFVHATVSEAGLTFDMSGGFKTAQPA